MSENGSLARQNIWWLAKWVEKKLLVSIIGICVSYIIYLLLLCQMCVGGYCMSCSIVNVDILEDSMYSLYRLMDKIRLPWWQDPVITANQFMFTYVIWCDCRGKHDCILFASISEELWWFISIISWYLSYYSNWAGNCKPFENYHNK